MSSPMEHWWQVTCAAPARPRSSSTGPKETGSGPRFWTLDQLTAFTAGERLSFDGMTARRVGELYIPPSMSLAGSDAGRYYNDATVERETEWLFLAGRPVYELLTP